MNMPVTEINKDTFWELISQAKENCGQDQDLAYQYGLWNAASIMCNGCSDDGFIDFRGWLIAQGRDIYFGALKDPDSLADVPAYGGCCYGVCADDAGREGGWIRDG